MNVQVVQIDPIEVAMIRHTGPYEELSPDFGRLRDWADNHKIPPQRVIGIYWDNPDYVDASDLRSAACIELPPRFQGAAIDGLAIELGKISGGKYATMRYVGPYEDMAPVWTKFTGYIEGDLSLAIRQDPAFEVYVNDPRNTSPQGLITDLFMPVV